LIIIDAKMIVLYQLYKKNIAWTVLNM